MAELRDVNKQVSIEMNHFEKKVIAIFVISKPKAFKLNI